MAKDWGSIVNAKTIKGTCEILDEEKIQYLLHNTDVIWWSLSFRYNHHICLVEKFAYHYDVVFAKKTKIEHFITDIKQRINNGKMDINDYNFDIMNRHDYFRLNRLIESVQKTIIEKKSRIIGLTEELRNLEFWLNQLEE